MEDTPKVTRLDSVRLVNFKSFVAETVPLAPLTLLVGGNASGKSNLLDALRFLHGLAHNHTLGDVLDGPANGGRTGWPGLRGGSKEAVRSGQAEFTIETRWHMDDGAELLHAITCRVGKEIELTAESLRVVGDDEPLFEVVGKPPDVAVAPGEPLMFMVRFRPAKREKGDYEHSVGRVATLTVLNQLDHDLEYDPRLFTYGRAVRHALRQINLLELEPRAMRAYASKKARTLGGQGDNLSAVVWRLCQDPERKQSLVDWLSELVSPRVVDIAFVEVPALDDVMLELVEESGARISARSLSDGTLRFLGTLVYLLTAPAGSLLLVEEVETGLHPTRAHLLVELLETVGAGRGCQVIATTHAPLVLLALPPAVLDQAVVFGRVPGEEGTLARRLGALPHFDEIAAKRGVDHLFTTGWLERAL